MPMPARNKNSQSKKTVKTVKTEKPTDNNGDYVAPETAVVSRLGGNKEAVITKGTKDVTTRHGSTIHYS